MLNGIEWDTSQHDLKEFAKANNTPQFIRIENGQFKNIGVSKNCQPYLYRDVLFHSVRPLKKVLAVGVKVREQRKATLTDLNLSIPSTYSGWFEILSEDGKAVRPYDTVRELAARFPDQCLIRSNVKSFLPNDRGELHMNNTRMVFAGEVLHLVGDVTVPHQQKNKPAIKLLRCRDQRSNTLFLHYDQKGQFSAIAKHDNVNGVHDMESIIDNFRLPVTVRLVHGATPSGANKTKFTGCFKFLDVESDEIAFIMPVTLREKMVPISMLRVPMKIRSALNMNVIRDTESYKHLHHRCSNMISSYLGSIHIRVDLPPGVYKARQPQTSQFYFGMQQLEEKIEQKVNRRPHSSQYPGVAMSESIIQTPYIGSKTEEDIIFEEIDDIYVYVRDGGLPPPPRKQQLQVAPPMEDDGQLWEDPAYETLGKYKRKENNTVHVHEHTTNTLSSGTDTSTQSSGRGSSESGPTNTSSSTNSMTQITQINVLERQRRGSKSPPMSSPFSSGERSSGSPAKLGHSPPSGHIHPRRVHTRANSADIHRIMNKNSNHSRTQSNGGYQRVEGRRQSDGQITRPVMFLEMKKSDEGVMMMNMSKTNSPEQPPPVPPKLFKRATSTPLLTNIQCNGLELMPPGLRKSISSQSMNEDIAFVPPYRRNNFNNIMNEASENNNNSDPSLRLPMSQTPIVKKNHMRTKSSALDNLRRKVRSMYM